jgi:hypothetical protein
MEVVESEFEVFDISETIGLSFQGLDFIVQSFDFSGGDFMVEVV